MRVKALIGGLIVLLVVAAGFGGWLLRGSGDSAAESASSSVTGGAVKVGVPTIVSTKDLESYAASHAPLYWAGPQSGARIELTQTARNGTFVRYLPKGAKAGDSKQYLTVATYDSVNGYNSLEGASKKVASVEHSKSGAVIAVFKKRPLSTYFSFKDATFQVEVYSPEEGESKKLTDDGVVTLVDGSKK